MTSPLPPHGHTGPTPHLGSTSSTPAPIGPARARRRVWLALGVGVLVLALVATVSWYQDRAGLIHQIAEPHPGIPAEFPAGPRTHAWTWSPPQDTTVVDLVRGTHGPIAVLDDGLIALDGADGRELWTYRELDATTPQDGNGWGVLGEHAYFLRPPEPDTPGRFTVLDAATGEVAWERTVDPQEGTQGRNMYSPLVGLHELGPGEARELSSEWGAGSAESGVLLARSAESGDELWAFRPPWPGEVCTSQADPVAYPPGGLTDTGALVVAHACMSEEELAELDLSEGAKDPLLFAGRAQTLTINVTALDPTTGRILWSDLESVTGPVDTITLTRIERAPPTPGAPSALLLETSPTPVRGMVLDPLDGEHVRHPEEAVDDQGRPIDPAARTLRADRRGAVVAVDFDDEAYVTDADWAFEAHEVDRDGEIVASVTVDEEEITPAHLANAVPLRDTLLVPHLDPESGAASVYAAPMGAEDEGGAWMEPLPLAAGPISADEVEHRLLVVPGAVVCHLTNGDVVTDVHGLGP